MTHVVRLDNKELDKIANDCGLTVDDLNRKITEREIEFFGEQIVKECILAILEKKPEEGSTKVYNELADMLKEKFDIKM